MFRRPFLGGCLGPTLIPWRNLRLSTYGKMRLSTRGGAKTFPRKIIRTNAAGAKGDGGSLSGSDLPAQAASYLEQQLLINNIKALHNCKEVLAELLPEVVLSSALTGFESMSKFDVIGAEGQSLFAHKARALRELAHVSPQLMKGTASEALVGLLRQ